eukprot:8632124-Alexandrium_andersonii.AAC.1
MGATGSRDAVTEALAWLVCRGLRPKVMHCGSLHLGGEPAKKMELLATERAKEAELISLLVEHQAQAGACAAPRWVLRPAGHSFPEHWCRVKFDGCQFGLKCLGERARGTGRDEKL